MKNTRRRLTLEEIEAAHHFHAYGLVLMPLCACGCGQHSVEVHHVIDAQQLRSENDTRRSLTRRDGLTRPLINVYDLRNGLGLAELCHVRHTRAVKRVSRRYLRAENFQFAREHKLTWWLDRFYPLPVCDRCGEPEREVGYDSHLQTTLVTCGCTLPSAPALVM